ncbi:hypothetical protein [Syntrophus aciditrophicus]|nr:hypothetical protein [Syntrophus aciditrophicus]
MAMKEKCYSTEDETLATMLNLDARSFPWTTANGQSSRRTG